MPVGMNLPELREGRESALGRYLPARRRRRSSLTKRRERWGLYFVLPALLFFSALKFGPMFWAIWLSFTSYDMVSTPTFIGLENYFDLASDPVFRVSLLNTLFYIGSSIFLITAVALGLALAINTRVAGARQCMTAMFLTSLMPIIAVCLVWKFLLHPYGPITQLLEPFGVARVNWLTNSATAMPSIILVTVWRFAPYFMIVFLAGLLSIPGDLYEAAHLDGASSFQRFRLITLPLLAPVLLFVVVVSGLLCARVFLLPYVLTGGGPGHATRVLSMLIYDTGFSYMRMGRAAAVSVILFGIMMLFTTLQMRLFLRGERIYG